MDVPSSLILLSLKVKISSANSRNATTASCKARCGHGDAHLTLYVAEPPRISDLRLYCSGSLSATEPYLVATERSFILLGVKCICIAPSCKTVSVHRQPRYEYFIYKLAPTSAAEEQSLLELLPEPVPSSLTLDNSYVGLLICPGNYFLVAALCYTSSPAEYTLHIYRSSTGKWETGRPVFNRHQENLDYYHANNKVITIGGEYGTMAWVDLWHGILICDVLSESSELRYIPLPPPLESTKELEGCPKSVRDIAVVDGRISYFELQIRVIQDLSSEGSYRSSGFVAAKWSINVSGTGTWKEDYMLDASQISLDDQLVDLQEFPELREDDAEAHRFVQLHTGHPTLSLNEDHVVYLMTKVNYMDEKAWVLAIDMRNNRIQGVAEFFADRVPGFCYTYTHMRVSQV